MTWNTKTQTSSVKNFKKHVLCPTKKKITTKFPFKTNRKAFPKKKLTKNKKQRQNSSSSRAFCSSAAARRSKEKAAKNLISSSSVP